MSNITQEVYERAVIICESLFSAIYQCDEGADVDMYKEVSTLVYLKWAEWAPKRRCGKAVFDLYVKNLREKEGV